MQDAWSKGRLKLVIKKGEDANGAKLTAEKVREIRRRYSGKHGELSSLGREFGVDHKSIFCIVRGITWKSVL